MGDSQSFDYQLPQGITAHRSFRVEGVDTVAVPAGTFRAWRVQVAEGTADGSIDGTYWYAPQIGGYVRAEITTTAPAPQPPLRYWLELTQAQVPPPRE